MEKSQQLFFYTVILLGPWISKYVIIIALDLEHTLWMYISMPQNIFSLVRVVFSNE